MPGLTWSARRSPLGGALELEEDVVHGLDEACEALARISQLVGHPAPLGHVEAHALHLDDAAADMRGLRAIEDPAAPAIAADHAVLELGVLQRGQRVAREELVVRQTVARMDRRLPRILGLLVGAQGASEDPLDPGPGVQLAIRVVGGEDAGVEVKVERPADLLVGLARAPEQVDERADEGADADQDRDTGRGRRDLQRSGAGLIAHERDDRADRDRRAGHRRREHRAPAREDRHREQGAGNHEQAERRGRRKRDRRSHHRQRSPEAQEPG